MAIKPTPNNNMFKSLVFDGVDSRDYGIYITGDAVFNSPERDVEMIEIPGRNGAYALDKGRFSNIKVSYPAGIAGDTEADFREGISAFRNALASRKGYKRLEDDYNPDEYRMAVYKSGLEVTPKALKAGEFTITFDCKPQRFLKSGETAVTIGGSVTNTQTKSGAVVALESDGGDAVTSLVAQIEPVQAGSGDPSPTNVRAITGWTAANVNVAGKNLINQRAAIDGTRTEFYRDINYSNSLINRVRLEAGKTYTLSFDISCSVEPFLISVGAGRGTYSSDIRTLTDLTSGRVGITFTPTETQLANGDVLAIRAPRFNASTTFTFSVTNMMLSTDGTATYEPYTGTTHSVSFGSAGTVYGGTRDVVTGALTVTHKMVDLGTLTWAYRTNSTKPYFKTDISDLPLKSVMRCSIYKQSTLLPNNASMPDYSMSNQAYFASAHNLIIVDSRYTDAASFKTAMNGVQLCYELTTPQTYNLTAQQVELLTGQNYVWADTGDTTLTYGRDPNKIVNPTLFDASPLLKVKGNGTIGINGEEVHVVVSPIGRIVVNDSTWSSSGFSQSDNFADIDSSLYATGDTILVNASFDLRFTASGISKYGFGSFSSSDSDATVSGYVVSKTDTRLEVYLTANNLHFVVGTASTQTASGVVTGTFGGSSLQTKTQTMSVAYDGDTTFTFTLTVEQPTNVTTVLGRIDNGLWYIDSTVSTISDYLYIDLDIGEAYMFDANNKIISLNDRAEIPANLPVLVPGANAITVEGAINELVVIPRWWEV